jgi:hypothetical protein
VSFASALASYFRAYSFLKIHFLSSSHALNIHVTLTRRLLQRTRRSPPPREHSPAPVRDRSHRTRVSPAPAPAPAPALAPAPVKEDPAVQSGSEEGEIEE